MSGMTGLARWARHLVRPSRTRQAVEESARRLLDIYRGIAYREARRRAREARGKRCREDDRHWTRVARAIARIEGREIGLKTADRYGY